MNVHIVSHTHWDREWYLTYEQFRLRLVGLVDRLLDLLESRPDFAFFHLDGQTIVLEDYLELRPQQEPRLRQLIADGRILIGPWYDMPDEFLVSGEALVRNLARGHRLARRFGTPMPVGYLPDLFGHVGQMPQILRNFGLDNAILWRGFGGRKAEYWWDAPDGSRVLMMHLPPEGYCNATRVHLKPEAAVERTLAAIGKEAARTAVGEVLLMNGVDHVEPHPLIPELARRVSEHMGVPVRHSTLPAYVDAVRTAVHDGAGKPLEVIRGELRGGEDYANLLPGVFSARTYIKQANARVQTLLEKRAEPLAVFASMLGAPYQHEELAYAWKTLLQNHPHDSICGCSVDAVHDENMTRFARAEQVARAIVDQAASVVARAVPAAPGGRLRLVAINTTGTAYNGVIETAIDLPYADAEPRRPDPEALDAPVTLWPNNAHVASAAAHDGRLVPLQILDEQEVITWVMSRYDTPWGLHARRVTLLLHGSVPACGYATFDLSIANLAPATPKPGRTALQCGDRSAENEHLRLSINDDGTVDIVDRTSGTRYQRCGELEDVADAGDEYNYSPPITDRRITSADARHVRVTRLHGGPLRAAFRITFDLRLPASLTSDRSTRSADLLVHAVTIDLSLDADSRRVGWFVSIDNRARDHRLRMLFPVGAAAIADVRAETAFDVVTRPSRREVPEDVRMEVPVSYGPTGSFTEAGSDQCGAIVFGDGLSEYEAYTDGDEPRLALTLLRCVEYLSRDDLAMRPSGHAGPGLFTPGAQCLGRHEFRLGFEPRRERPAPSALFARAAPFVAPPHVVPAIGAGGSLPAVDAFVSTGALQGQVVLSACHRAEDSERTLLRFFNPDETPAAVAVSTRQPLTEAIHVNFLEEPLGDARVRNGAATIAMAPHGIATVLVK
jgi:mannosylglycerate hydrolase